MVFPGGRAAFSSGDVAHDRNPFLRPSSCELEIIEAVSPNRRPGTRSPSAETHLSGHTYEGVAQEDVETRTISLRLEPKRGLSTPDISNYKPHNNHKFVKWQLILQQPIYMLLFTTAGISLAIGHHFYNTSLRGTKAGNEAAQQGQIWMGTAFSNSSIFFLNSAIAIAFVQSIWWEVRSRGFSVATLDNLFGLDKDITGFFNWNLLRRAKIAVLIGFVIWGMPLTVIVPPGTISVVPGTHLSNKTQQIAIPSFNWTTEHGEGLLRFIYNSKTKMRYGNPYPQPLRLASIISQAASVNPPIGMIPNSTITQQFYGPALQCLPPNATQQAAFDKYNDLVYAQENIITVPKLLSGNYTKGYSQLQFFSAFSPQLYGYINDVDQEKGVPDHYNNWEAILPGLSSDETRRSSVRTGAEFWIQLASKSLICSLTNASFDIAFDATGLNGTPAVIQRSITHINRWNSSSPTESYVGVMSALGAVLYGNVTVLWYDCEEGQVGKCFMSRQTNSQVLQTGLGACEGDDGFENSWWSQNLDQLNRTHAPGPITFGNDGKSWMCRNGSIEKALEDLAVNVTIGMLGVEAANFKPLYPIVNTTIWSLPNVYSYEAKNLIISYGVGIFATLCCITIGLRLFIANGISHDSSFSALMTTTRNPDLDELSVGQSLSSIGKTLADTKLKFGWYTVEGEKEDLHGLKRAAFGKVDKVGTLRKGDEYI